MGGKCLLHLTPSPYFSTTLLPIFVLHFRLTFIYLFAYVSNMPACLTFFFSKVATYRIHMVLYLFYTILEILSHQCIHFNCCNAEIFFMAWMYIMDGWYLISMKSPWDLCTRFSVQCKSFSGKVIRSGIV